MRGTSVSLYRASGVAIALMLVAAGVSISSGADRPIPVVSHAEPGTAASKRPRTAAHIVRPLSPLAALVEGASIYVGTVTSVSTDGRVSVDVEERIAGRELKSFTEIDRAEEHPQLGDRIIAFLALPDEMLWEQPEGSTGDEYEWPIDRWFLMDGDVIVGAPFDLDQVRAAAR